MSRSHKMKSLSLLLVLFICYAAIGCNIYKTEEEIEKTYPPASNFSLTNINQILNNPPDSGNYNLQVYVVEINECPVNLRCDLEDGILISQEYTTTASTENIHLGVNQPRQFKVGKQYILSIKVEPQGYVDSISGKPVSILELIGYDFSQ